MSCLFRALSQGAAPIGSHRSPGAFKLFITAGEAGEKKAAIEMAVTERSSFLPLTKSPCKLRGVKTRKLAVLQLLHFFICHLALDAPGQMTHVPPYLSSMHGGATACLERRKKTCGFFCPFSAPTHSVSLPLLRWVASRAAVCMRGGVPAFLRCCLSACPTYPSGPCDITASPPPPPILTCAFPPPGGGGGWG